MKPTPDPATWKPLPKSLKNRFPFKLSVPSFIYPGTWSANAEMLGPYVDEIELLFFESRPEGALPDRREIDSLIRISEELSIRYNIHLPADISLASPDRGLQIEAIDTLCRVLDLTAGIDPSSYTLHIPYDAPDRSETEIQRWRERARKGIEKIVASGFPARRLAIENLDYPFEWIETLIWETDLSICMDMGHLLVGGGDIGTFYRKGCDRIVVIHLHGVRDGQDHLSLTALSAEAVSAIQGVLEGFSGTLSLEVFSYDRLVPSVEWMEGECRVLSS